MPPARPAPLAAVAAALAFLLAAPRAAADAEETAFQARAAHLMNELATNTTWQPSPNFSDAHKHYWVTGLSLVRTSPLGVNHPSLNDGSGDTAARPPLRWGILKYDAESSTGTTRGVASGTNISFSNNPGIFHFILPGLAALAGLHPDIPAWDHPFHRDTSRTYRQQYLRMVLQRTDNYNAFTGEGTENHVNMSRTSAWVLASEAARLGVEAPAGAPFTAAQRRDQMRAWILGWGRRVAEVGFGEWDSGTYHAISMQGWLVAYAYAGTPHGRDPEVRAVARAVLDQYATILAVKQTAFMMGGAESRGDRNYAQMNSGTTYLAYLWFGEGSGPPPGSFRRNQMGEAIYGAIGDYRPPIHVVRLARRVPAAGETFVAGKPRYLLQRARESVEVFHRAPTYTLGSVNSDIGGFHSASFAWVNWKLLTRPAPGAFPDVVSGNGGFYSLNAVNYRDPWTQFVQHRNVLIQLHRVPADAAAIVSAVQAKFGEWQASWYADFTARWASPDWGGFNGSSYNGRTIPLNFQASAGTVANARTSYVVYPATATASQQGDARFLQLGSTWLAIRSIRLASPAINTTNRTVTDTGAAGELFGLVVEVGNATEHGTFAAWRDAILASTSLDRSARDTANRVAYTSLAGETITATYGVSGSWTEPDFDWDHGIRTPGGIALQHEGAWQQPAWPSGDGHGRVPTVTVGGQPVDPSPAVLLDGPGVRHAGGVLELRDGATTLYRMDFTGTLPVFTLLLPGTAVTSGPSGTRVAAATSTGLRYRLESSPDLRAWTDLTGTVAGTGADLVVDRPASAGAEFYRVVVMP